jgi:hypothetical protein
VNAAKHILTAAALVVASDIAVEKFVRPAVAGNPKTGAWADHISMGVKALIVGVGVHYLVK